MYCIPHHIYFEKQTIIYLLFGNNNFMKKLLLCFLSAILVFMVGCDNQGLQCAHLTNGTQGLSRTYAVRMVLDNDSRVEERFVDLQIKSSASNLTLNFGEERQDRQDIVITNGDEWYNITVLLANSNGMSGNETYEKYGEKGNMTYIFTTKTDATLTFRVVVGEAVQNDAGTGYVLTSIEKISNELEIKAKVEE